MRSGSTGRLCLTSGKRGTAAASSERGSPVSAMCSRMSPAAAALPRFSMLKHNVGVEPDRIHSLLQRLHDELERERLDYDQTDGIKVSWPDGWVHVRVSNTESLVRVITEAGTAARARELLDWARDRLGR